MGNDRDALKAARQLLPPAEATGYKPLIAEVQYLIGSVQSNTAPADAEAVIEKTLYLAEAAHDDFTAAKAAIYLVGLTGNSRARRPDSERWPTSRTRFSTDWPRPAPDARLVTPQPGSDIAAAGDFANARPLLESALAIKETQLGRNHPDVARTAATLTWALTELHRPADALPLAERAVEILGKLDPDSTHLAYALNNRGDALSMVGRYDKAEESYRAALRILASRSLRRTPTVRRPVRHRRDEARPRRRGRCPALPR